MIFMYGGTDGNEYFSDTWNLDIGATPGVNAKWTLIFPDDEGGAMSLSPSPSARAFAAHNNNNGGVMLVFGGRTGGLPTGEDTDGDLVADSVELEIGGSPSGRDPRANALLPQSALHNLSPGGEEVPYAFQRIGGVRAAGGVRPAVADFESLEMIDLDDAALATLNRTHALIYDLPVETGALGYNAADASVTTLWWSQYGGADGNKYDERNVWEIGIPHPEGISEPNLVPPKAYNGRWCYGTDLNGSYPDNATMELYTPLMDLTLPDFLNSTDWTNTNNFYLVFHEWLDLAEGDSVRIEAIRPRSSAQRLRRYSSLPIVPVMGSRFAAANTDGKWRRVILPLDTLANEPEVYVRFILQSDESDRAGGWYLDDVAVLQAGEITGFTANPTTKFMELYGINGTNALNRVTVGVGTRGYGFELLAAGTYRVRNPDTGASMVVNIGQNLWTRVTPGLTVAPLVLDLHIGGPSMVLSWPAVVGGRYIIQAISPADLGAGGAWTTLTTVTATSETAEFIDNIAAATGAKLYRVLFIGTN